MMKLFNKTTRPSQRCGWRDPSIACCLAPPRPAWRTGQSCGALVRLRLSIGCCEAAQAKRTWWFWPTRKKKASGVCSGTYQLVRTVWKEPHDFWCSCTSQRWVPHRPSHMIRHGHQWNDSPSSSSKRLKRQRWQRTAPEWAIVHRSDVARRASCTHCWLTVGRHKWGRRANLLSSAVISWLTQCGKTWEWRRPPHLLLAAGPMVDSMWDDWSRHGYIKNVRDMSAFCPTVGRSATGLVKILITAKRWHSCGNLNFILSVFVALTTRSIYIAVLLRPGTFPFWYRHRACDLRAGAVFFVGHRLKSS